MSLRTVTALMSVQPEEVLALPQVEFKLSYFACMERPATIAPMPSATVEPAATQVHFHACSPVAVCVADCCTSARCVAKGCRRRVTTFRTPVLTSTSSSAGAECA